MNLRLKAAIVAKCGTQTAFATFVGRADSYISEVIRGRRNPSAEERHSWALILQTDESIFDSCPHPKAGEGGDPSPQSPGRP